MTKLILTFFLLASANQSLMADITVKVASEASELELNAAKELLKDLERVTDDKVSISETASVDAKIIELVLYKDLPDSLKSRELLTSPLASEQFVLDAVSNERLLLVGADERALFYAAYEFSEKHLKIDPLEYWTGKEPKKLYNFDFSSIHFKSKPPKFKLRGYFDNDSDMIANWKGDKLIIEFETWKEIIDSLARLRFNFIDIHDTLGRSEFWKWDYYKNKTDYKTDLDLVEKIIDYAHSKAMLVQVPMYLGWQFYHIDDNEVCLSENYDRWFEVYNYYLKQSPLGKADIFLQRPRHPFWDVGYNCPSERRKNIKTGPLMTKMFNDLNRLVKAHNPKSLLVCDLWHEGRDMWRRDEFLPDRDILMIWADYGVADFREWPTDLKGYDFGLYIHAGVWLNHVMQDPHPKEIFAASEQGYTRAMNNYYLVNGQDFRHFILNIEATARASFGSDDVDGDNFYQNFVGRYFNEKSSIKIIESLKLLHKAHYLKSKSILPRAYAGYKEITESSRRILDQLARKRPTRRFDRSEIESSLKILSEAKSRLMEAELSLKQSERLLFNDQFVFPLNIFTENMKFLNMVLKAHNDRFSGRPVTVDLKKQLLHQRELLIEGSDWKKWDGWTHPDNFRVYTPHYSVKTLEKILKRIK